MAESAYQVLNTAKYYCTLRLSEYSRPDPFDTSYFKPKKTIRLPLPMELRDDTAVAFNNVDTQLIGDLLNGDFGSGLAAEGLRQIGTLGSSIIGAGAAVLGAGAAASTSLGSGLAQKVTGEALTNAFQADQITAAVQSGLGVAPNPNPTVVFQGPQLREMTLSWTFMPTNEKDSQTIRQLIKTLKRAALPGNSVTNSAAVLQYPNLCMVNFYPWDKNGKDKYGWSENSIIKMKPAFMSSVNVNYTSGNMPAFFSGWNNEPVVIQLTITFKEVEYFLANDYGGENGGGAIDLWGAFLGLLNSGAGEDTFADQPPTDDTSNETQDAADT